MEPPANPGRFNATETGEVKDDDFTVSFAPKQRWRVINNATGEVVASGYETRDLATEERERIKRDRVREAA